MVNYYYLIKKDLMMLFKNRILLVMLLYPFGISFISISSVDVSRIGILISLSILFTVYVGSITIMSVEEKDKIDIVFKSLPVRQVTLVNSRYITIILFYLIALATVSIIPLTNGVVAKNLDIYLASYGISLFILFIYVSVMQPLYYRFGYMKLSHITRVLYMLIILIPFLYIRLRDFAWGQSIMEAIEKSGMVIVSNRSLAILLCLSMLTISIKLSHRFFRQNAM
ncbi:MAG: ABC-2 transporter permease [Eubacteriales bacterium]|nr:ABC-2 transporter permease [Eubacteriales bacterium]